MTRSVRTTLVVATLCLAALAWAFPLADLNAGVTSAASQAVISFMVVRVLVSLLQIALGTAIVIGGRFSRLSVAFFLFALSRAAQPAVIWVHVLPPQWHAVATLLAAIVAAISVYGFVTLCLRMPIGDVLPRWRIADAILPVYAIAVGLTYAYWDYRIFSALIWFSYLVGFLGYLDRAPHIDPGLRVGAYRLAFCERTRRCETRHDCRDLRGSRV